MDPYRHIIEQHIDDAAFLWVLRSVAVDQPHYLTSDIVSLESRIDKHLDGILASLSRAWPLCLRAAEFEEGGEAFLLAVTAFRSLEVEKIKQSVDLAVVNDETFKGFVSAMGWLPGKLCHDWIKRFFTSKDLAHKHLAIAACSVRREDPADYLTRILEREDCIADQPLYARSIRIAGELKRRDLIDKLEIARLSDDDCIRFWAIWSLVMMGKLHLALELEGFVHSPGPLQQKAIELAFRVLPMDTARQWISNMSNSDENARAIIRATGVLGDPQAMPWLIEMMKTLRVARVAGEAFSLISGIDLEEHDLALEIPSIETLEEDMDPGEINEDENLAWPCVEKLAVVWQKYGQGFTPGNRYFLGKPLNNDDFLRTTVLHGFQRSRHAAALELSIRHTGQILVNTSASHPF